MNTSWERITRLLDAARALDGAARAAFVDAACAGDPDVRSQIESLLSASAVDDGFLAEPPYVDLAGALQQLDGGLPNGCVLKERYTIQDSFGSGGQARVYRATDQVLSRPVVVKVMTAAGMSNSTLKRRFEQEMKALSRIDHPAVVGIFDVGELSDGSPFLVIQYIDGVSLRTLVAQGQIDSVRAGAILRAIAAALTAAHAAGVIHQDLKPENVMIQRLADGSDAVKLIDFGIAKIDRSDLAPAITTVMIAGSVRYMAPEQFEGVNLPASDTYSLGRLACELLCGDPDVRALPAQHGHVREILERAVAFRPEDRPTDLNAWARDLCAALANPRPARRVVRAAAVVAAVAALAWAGVARVSSSREGHERIIEKVGAFDPTTEGFQTHNDAVGTVVFNGDRTGYIGWSVTSAGPGGYYFRRLTDSQKTRGLDHGWTLSATMQPVAGRAFVGVDFVGRGRRFDIDVEMESEDDIVVQLTTQIVPTISGMELRLPGARQQYHLYELRFDPGLQAADLWIDGQRRLTGYRGHGQFQDDMGMMFGAGPYKSERGTALFQSVRFEIHP